MAIVIRPFAHSKDYGCIHLIKLRASDLVEIKASLDINSEDAVALSVARSTETFVVEEDGVIRAIFGVRHATSGELGLDQRKTKSWRCGIPWYLGELPLRTKDFIKLSRQITKEMFDKFDFLCNYIALSNIKSIKWLLRLGYRLSEQAYIFNDPNEPFVIFYRSAHNV